MREYLVIEGVNLDLLEAQRQVMSGMPLKQYLSLSEDVRKSLDGIVNMLAIWSDRRLGMAVGNYCAEMVPQLGAWPEAFLWQGESYDKHTYQMWLDPVMKQHWDSYIVDPLRVKEVNDES